MINSRYNWSNCTPYDFSAKAYNVFLSKYKNLRYVMNEVDQYVVSSDDIANLPGISFKLYGTTDLWRILMEYNGLSDPLSDIYIGLVLRVPDKSDILTLLSQNDETGETVTI